jgi:hypothetical protein
VQHLSHVYSAPSQFLILYLYFHLSFFLSLFFHSQFPFPVASERILLCRISSVWGTTRAENTDEVLVGKRNGRSPLGRPRRRWWIILKRRRNRLGIFLFTTASRTVLGATQPSIQWVPGALSLGVKRPESEADHSPASSAEVKNAWSCTSTPPVRLHGVVLS